MKKSLFALLFLCLCTLTSFSQSTNDLQAQVLNYEESIVQGKSVFKLIIKPTVGSIKVGDFIDGVARDGDRCTFQITAVTVGGAAATKIATGQKGEAVAKPVDQTKVDRFVSQFSPEMPFVARGATVDGMEEPPSPVAVEPLPLQELHCKVNGQARTASSFGLSNLFYTKGISSMRNGDPFLILAFKTADGNQFTFMWKTTAGKVGKVDYQSLEVVYSGTEAGKDIYVSNHGSGRADKPLTPFALEFTQWKVINANEVECTFKFSGTLYQLMSGESTKIELGEVKNTRVTVYTERY
jgi:hypothetical protein